MPKQLINVLGAAVVIAVIVIGFLAFGAPAITQATATAAQIDQVALTNRGYQQQVDSLEAAKRDFSTLKADVAALRAQIPAHDDRDDVFEIVAQAATASGAQVSSVTALDPVAWAARTGASSSAAAGAAASGGDAAAPAATPAPTPAPSAPPAAGGSASADTAAAGRTQVPFTIVVKAATPAVATAFLDALGAGPRLIGITSTSLTKADTAVQLTVNALAFVRSEK